MLKIIHGNDLLILDQDDYYITEKYDGLDELEFNASIYETNYKYIIEETVVHEEQDYIIKAIDAGKSTAKVKCKLDLDTLKSDLYLNYTNNSDTALGTIREVLPPDWIVTDFTGDVTRRTIEKEAATCFDIINECLNVYGITVRYDNRAKTVTIIKPAQNAPFGAFLTSELNLTELNYKGKSNDFVTRLYAYGKDGLSFADINDGKEYVDDNTYSNRVISAYWKDERYTDRESLLADTKLKLSALSVPQRSYSCNILDLAKTNPEMYSYQDFSLHNAVTLIDIDKNIRLNHSVVEYKRYPYYPEKNVVTLSTVAPKIQSAVKELQSEIKNPDSGFRTDLQNALDRSTEIITGGKGGNYVVNKTVDGKPFEVLFMDTADKVTAKNVLRINKDGIGFSSNGYNGPFSSAWTIDGHFNANYITAGTINTGLVTIQTPAGESAFDATKNEVLDSISKYIRFENGNIVLGTSESKLTLKIQNDKIAFYENGVEIAYWENRKFFAVDGEFINALQLGKFAFIPRSNGNLSFKKVVN